MGQAGEGSGGERKVILETKLSIPVEKEQHQHTEPARPLSSLLSQSFTGIEDMKKQPGPKEVTAEGILVIAAATIKRPN